MIKILNLFRVSYFGFRVSWSIYSKSLFPDCFLASIVPGWAKFTFGLFPLFLIFRGGLMRIYTLNSLPFSVSNMLQGEAKNGAGRSETLPLPVFSTGGNLRMENRKLRIEIGDMR